MRMIKNLVLICSLIFNLSFIFALQYCLKRKFKVNIYGYMFRIKIKAVLALTIKANIEG
jgi:hypothetical protein